MSEKRTVNYETITRVKHTTLRRDGNKVCIELHCDDPYMAEVLAEDLIDRAKTQRLMVQFGKASTIKAKLT